MFIIKKEEKDTWVYRREDEPGDYIIEDGMCNEYNMYYAESEAEVMYWVDISMDVDTEIMVVPASEVLDCPLIGGYFYY